MNDEFSLNGGNVNNAIVLNATDDVYKITKPLYDYMNISYFSFARLYHDSTRIYLNPFQNFVTLYNNSLFLNAQFNKNASNYMVSSQFWSTYGDTEIKLLMQNSFNISDGLVIVWKNKTYTDIYIFALPYEFKNPHAYLLDNQCYLQHFCVYFRESTKKIIIATTDYDRKYLKTWNGEVKLNIETRHKTDLERFIKLTTPNSIALLEDEVNCLFSQREIICLLHMLKGLSAKKSAAKLEISHRTVQKHIQNAKEKLNTYSKDELLSVLSQYGLDNLII